MRNVPVLAALILLFAAPASAQLLTRDITEKTAAAPKTSAAMPAGNNIPLEITADNSLEWQRNDKTFIARGNAVAKQGDTTVNAATLTAHYSEKTGGGMKISKVQADGNVVIHSKDTDAFGSKVDYDLDKGYALMTGDDLHMKSPDQTVTAHEKFEYWVKDGKFSAVGRAKVVRAADTLEADKISAIMKTNEKGQRVLETLQAEGNVVITTPTETVTGASGIYRSGRNMAEMKGGVKITRGPNTLEGESAEVDMNTNTSRIFGSASEGGRVKGVFYPGSEKTP